MDNINEIIGTVAGIFTISMFFPQSWKVVKTKTIGNLKVQTFLAIFIATIIYTIWGAMNSLIPTIVANIAVSALMLPILFYMFRHKKYLFIIIINLWVFTLVFAILKYIKIYNFGISKIINLTLSLVSGGLLTFSFVPQIFNVIKNKKIGHISIVGTFLILFTNFIWGTYWILKFEEKTLIVIPQIIFIVIGSLFQLPIVYFYFKKDFKNTNKKYKELRIKKVKKTS